MDRREDYEFHGFMLPAATRGGEIMIGVNEFVRELGFNWPDVKNRLGLEHSTWQPVLGTDELHKEGGLRTLEFMPLDRFRLFILTLHWERCDTAQLLRIEQLQRAVVAELEYVNFHQPVNEDGVVAISAEEYQRLKLIDKGRGRGVKRPRLTKEERQQMVAAYEAGRSVRSIAKQLDRPSTSIYYALKALGVDTRPKNVRTQNGK